MRVDASARLLIGIAAALAVGLFFLMLTLATNQVLVLWERLQSLPSWLLIGYLSLLGAFALASGWLFWRLLRPRRREPPQEAAALDEASLAERLARYQDAGIPVSAATAELALLAERRLAGTLFLSFFGEISSGKSSLLRALVPEAEVEVGVIGGTTRSVSHHRWRSPAGIEIVLADVAGSNEANGAANAQAEEEALRAHVVVYVCDGDLTRTQWQEVERLRQYGKPLIVALNKRDRYHAEDLAAIRARIAERLPDAELAAVQAGGSEQVVRLQPDGSEQVLERPRPAELSELIAAIERAIAIHGPNRLELRREQAVLRLTQEKLQRAVAESRRERAEAAIERYTRRAVVGALAAVAPGTDLVIQGALATALLRELTDIYEVSVRDVDLDRFLEAARKRAGKALPLTLAVAGNGLKAFPGMGTLTGGLLHAVAYGLLFQSLGRAVAESLRQQGELIPAQTLRRFEDELGEDLAQRARQVAAMALRERDKED